MAAVGAKRNRDDDGNAKHELWAQPSRKDMGEVSKGIRGKGPYAENFADVDPKPTATTQPIERVQMRRLYSAMCDAVVAAASNTHARMTATEREKYKIPTSDMTQIFFRDHLPMLFEMMPGSDIADWWKPLKNQLGAVVFKKRDYEAITAAVRETRAKQQHNGGHLGPRQQDPMVNLIVREQDIYQAYMFVLKVCYKGDHTFYLRETATIDDYMLQFAQLAKALAWVLIDEYRKIPDALKKFIVEPHLKALRHFVNLSSFPTGGPKAIEYVQKHGLPPCVTDAEKNEAERIFGDGAPYTGMAQNLVREAFH